MAANGTKYGTAALLFETWTDVANLSISSPQGSLECNLDANNPLLFNCSGSALQPGTPVTIQACGNLQQTLPQLPQTCPCTIEGLTAAVEGNHIRVKWNASPQSCAEKTYLGLQCDGVHVHNIILPGNHTELVLDGCPLPYTDQEVCLSCIDPDGNPGEPSCYDLPYLPSPTCPVFYKLNPNTNLCEYTPIWLVQCDPPDVVVPGYGCLPAPQSGNCPVGYYEAGYNNQPVCVPAGGPICQGSTCPATCPEGLVFDDARLCCDYPPDSAPVCPVGYEFDTEVDACLPQSLASTCCTTLEAVVPECTSGQPVSNGCLVTNPSTGGLYCASPCPVGVISHGACTP